MPADLVAFDLETTGLSPRSDRIIEIGAVRFASGGALIDRLDLLVDPGIPVPVAIQRLTGLRDADLAGGLTPVEAVAVLADFADGAELVAHGAPFDLAHCAAVLPGVFGGRRCQDTLELARILLPTAPSHSLPRLAAALEIEHSRPHRALPDAEATRLLLLRLVDTAAGLPAETLSSIRALVEPRRDALARFFAELVGGPGVAGRPSLRGTPTAPRRRPGRPPPSADGAPPPTLAAAAAAALGPGGALELALPGFELREAQVEMARAVAQTLDRGGRLLVEAGTGTGKSIGYLAPLLLWGERTGRRAVVATHTITLQEQLAERDLPRLAEALGVGSSAAMLKGRNQYLSLRRWHRLLATVTARGPAVEIDALRFCLKVLCWLAETASGDRSELRLSGTEEAWWHQVMSDAGDCLGSACANWREHSCFMVASRLRASQADVVVTNHALLVADAERQGQVLGVHSALVIDEAQHLEEAATRQLGHVLRAGDVAALLAPARLPVAEDSDLGRCLARAREAARRLFGEVKHCVAATLGVDQPGNARIGLTAEMLAAPELAPLRRAAGQAAAALRETAAALEGLGDDEWGQAPGVGAEATPAPRPAPAGPAPPRPPVSLLAGLLPQPAAAADELALAAGELGTTAEAIGRILGGEPRRDVGDRSAAAAAVEEWVAWLELRAEQAEIHEAPAEVAGALGAAVFEPVEAAVLTSATLSVAGSFDFVRRRTGVGGGAALLRLPAPFDYLGQALTVLPSGMPAYDAEGYDTALAELVTDVARRLDGRTLVLFTGYAPLRACHGRLGRRLAERGIALLGQGLDGTRRQILESFLAAPRSVLLGTTSFWEGLDLPGSALRCVVIAKLPFPVPTDPLVQARAARLGDPFRQLLLPIAVLRLKQGFGRLIRRGDDRGAVVLCDARIMARDYGATFLEALPEAEAVRVPLDDVGRVVEGFVRDRQVPASARVLAARPSSRASDDDWEPS